MSEQLDLIERVRDTLILSRHRWWLFGGWGLDALIGEVTRSHGDVEVWVERCDGDGVRDALVTAGAVELKTQPPEEAREFHWDWVPFSSAFFDRRADGSARCLGRWSDWEFPVGSFAQTWGHLGALTVPVMSAAGMLAMKVQFPTLRQGRPLREKDVRDIALLNALVAPH